MSAPPLSFDARRVLAAQALRAFGYGFGAVLLGATPGFLALVTTKEDRP